MNSDGLEERIERLEKSFEEFSRELRSAMDYTRHDAASSLMKSRTVLEKLVKRIYLEEMQQEPRKPLLGEMLADNQFTRKLQPRRIVSRMNAIRDLCNLGVHGDHVVASDASMALENLAEVLDWFLERSNTAEPTRSRKPGEGANDQKQSEACTAQAPDPEPTSTGAAPRGSQPKPAWASAAGDDQFGHWAELTVNKVVQRLRWIEPGEFWMGSPDSEPGREANEGPRHRVRISRGFWLADTVCTQALWLAVVGGTNPSKYADNPNNPVEQVSDDDVRGFLQALNHHLRAGVEAVLPTEAQWEYACRAGTETAFSFGDSLAPGFAHCLHRGFHFAIPRLRTVSVKSLPPNRWGLYEMHGNVWEWCDDGLRTYEPANVAEPAIDPVGPRSMEAASRRVVRGGSWFIGARGLRSACRIAWLRGWHERDLGFRFALRSTS